MNTNNRILILGSSGLVGQTLSKKLNKNADVYETYHIKKIQENDFHFDITSEKSIKKLFELTKPEVVVNLCTIYNDLEFCENNKELVMTINGTALKHISNFSNIHNAFLVNISSDFVFDGRYGNYEEDDPVSPINYYGLSKAEGEKNIKELSKNYCIVRTSMIFGRNDLRKTLSERILDGVNEKNGFRVIFDQFMKPTYLENFCNMLTEVIERKYYGIIHLAGATRMSRYEFGMRLLERLNLNKDALIPVKRTEFTFGKMMPEDSSLNTKRATSLLREKPEEIDESFDKYLKQI